MNKLKVGILSVFHSWDEAYSLTSVVGAQLTALVKYGYSPVLYVLTTFKDDDKVPKGVEIRKVIPHIILVDYTDLREPYADFYDQAEKIYTALKEHTQDVDIIIQHDLIFQGWFLPHAVAIHRLANESTIKWFHWMHSCPSDRPQDVGYPHSLRFALPRNSKLVYLNNKHLIRAAEMYAAFPKDVRIIYNSVDPRLLWASHPLVKDLIDKYDLLSADYIDIYPVSTTRMVDGKQIKTVVEVMAALKKLGKSVRFIACNAHANDKREKQVVAEVISFANQKGLSSNEVIFTSMESPDYESGIPREAVSQLFLLSNIFIFPSISENCSLILLEAMMAKNLLVLNDNPWLPFREFAKENALYFDFGSQVHQVTHQNRDGFMLDVAKIINSEMSTNRALNASTDLKKNFNYDAIFKQLENLFYEQ